MTRTLESSSAAVTSAFVADHLALDFLNTVAMVEGRPVDFLGSDDDVWRWLVQAGLAEAGSRPEFSSLLDTAKSLRELIRTLVAKRKAGGRADTAAFNAFLQAARSYPQLMWENRKAPRIERIRDQWSPAALLAPVAEAAADLIVNGDFELIRKCEDDACVLWFYDRTKSHRRRWCSMAVCGNRNKVKAFRQRQLG
jgi:predicted RNA-binding Zn ribbon-like protein